MQNYLELQFLAEDFVDFVRINNIYQYFFTLNIFGKWLWDILLDTIYIIRS